MNRFSTSNAIFCSCAVNTKDRVHFLHWQRMPSYSVARSSYWPELR